MTSNTAAVAGDQKKISDDPMKQTILIIEHKIRNLEKRKLKLEGYLQQQREGFLLSDDQLVAASKFNEVVSTLDFARNLKNQLSSLLTTTKQKKNNVEVEKLPPKVDSKIKEVLIFQNILESIKNENVKQDLLTGNNGAVQLTDDELSKLLYFSKMVSPKRRVEEGKPLFEDQLKTVSKHYLKLIESKPNIVAGTSYANLKECLLKIENSRYLDQVIKVVDRELETPEVDNSLENKLPEIDHEPLVSISDHVPDIMPSVPNEELVFTADKIETIYFINNSIGESTIQQEPYQNSNAADSVFNTSFDFLQDSQLDDELDNGVVNVDSIPTQTFSSSLYISNGPPDEAILEVLSTPPQNKTTGSDPYKETELNHLPVNNWQNNTEVEETNNLPKENWSMAQVIDNNSNNDWLVKNNWVQMVEEDKQQQKMLTLQPTQTSHKNSSTNFGLVTNGYTESTDELLQKTVVFKKQESHHSTTSSNNLTYYQHNREKQSLEQNSRHYTNSNNSYDRGQYNDYNKKSASSKFRAPYTGGSYRGYQQGSSYVYNNRSYRNNGQHFSNANQNYSQTSRQTQ